MKKIILFSILLIATALSAQTKVDTITWQDLRKGISAFIPPGFGNFLEVQLNDSMIQWIKIVWIIQSENAQIVENQLFAHFALAFWIVQNFHFATIIFVLSKALLCKISTLLPLFRKAFLYYPKHHFCKIQTFCFVINSHFFCIIHTSFNI